MVQIKEILANRSNFGNPRVASDIKYIVIHYTANDGDKAENNGKYFQNNIVQASAHYFVDDTEIVRSVPDEYVAWSVGGKRYATGGRLYGKANNANTLNIELCDTQKNVTVAPTENTVLNALELVRAKMEAYNIPQDHVIRHFDVNGKPCPAYWVNDSRWRSEFWDRITVKSAEKVLTPVASPPDAVYRLYNANTGEHFFTCMELERDTLRRLGWGYEGVAWTKGDKVPVFRLYNPIAGNHFYTTNDVERDVLTAHGWQNEGVAFYAEDSGGEPITRLYEPESGAHMYTSAPAEIAYLENTGWLNEGIAFYGKK